MPVMDGISAMKIIKNTAMDVPIIALTANAMTTEIEKYLSEGFTAHISKPIDRRVFITTVEKYFDGISGADIDLDESEMAELKAGFVAGLADDLSQIKTHVRENDRAGLGARAHAIKGAAAMYGYAHLGDTAGQLEIAVNNNDPITIDRLAQTIIGQLSDIVD